MKILYAVQGTGNGHVSRAREILPILEKYGDLDVFLSGKNSQVELPCPIKYRSEGLTMYYTPKGSVDYWQTGTRAGYRRVLQEVRDFPVEAYDLIINDFEFITAYACKLKNKPCVAFSHQSAFLSPKVPKPDVFDPIGSSVLKYYAPSSSAVGLHFDEFDTFIKKPIIRQEIRQLEPNNGTHFTLYLPHYHDSIVIKALEKIDAEFHIFSKHTKNQENLNHKPNIKIFLVHHQTFTESLKNCAGLITGAGFEAPAEAIFLGKKVMALPIMGQYEQLCNAEALRQIGVQIVQKIDQDFPKTLEHWIENAQALRIDYPDHTVQTIEEIVRGK